MNKNKLICWISTGLVSLLLGAGGIRYFVDPSMKMVFTNLHFPTWLIIPMGVAKIVGVICLWAPIPSWLREWTYAGFTFNLLLALGAHIAVQDGEYLPPIIGLTLLWISRYIRTRVPESKN